MTNEEILNPDIQAKIKSIWSTHINEGISGRLICTTYAKKKIANIIGIQYETMGKEKKRLFNFDIISGYQNGYFKKNYDY